MMTMVIIRDLLIAWRKGQMNEEWMTHSTLNDMDGMDGMNE